MGLKPEDSIRIEKKRKWKKQINCTFYVYECLDCGKEVELRRYELKRAQGRCGSCTAVYNGRSMISKNGIRPYEALYNNFKSQIALRKKKCDVSFEDFLEFTKTDKCHYCDEPIKWASCRLKANGSKYNLDRKDNDQDYLKINLVVCCWPCNERKKHLFTYEQFVQIGKLIKNWNKGRT